ncbi:MAG: hypothetical protein ACI9YB_000921, partial [Halioglobus sp.]
PSEFLSTVYTGQSVTLSVENLANATIDIAQDQLVYSLSGLPHNGVLINRDTAMQEGDSFTITELAEGIISYSHNSSDTTSDHFHFTTADTSGTLLSSDDYDLEITPAPVTDDTTTPDPVEEPVIDESHEHTNSTTPSEFLSTVYTGQSVTLSVEDLANTTINIAQDQLVYSLSGIPHNGVLINRDTAMQAGDSFTITELAEGIISYSHNSSDTTSDHFHFTTSDTSGTLISSDDYDFEITPAPIVDDTTTPDPVEEPIVDTTTVVDPAELIYKSSVEIGSYITLSSDDFHAYQQELPSDQLLFVLSGPPHHGSIKISGVEVTGPEGFTTSDLELGNVVYTNDGSLQSADHLHIAIIDAQGNPLNYISYEFELYTGAGSPAPIVYESTLDEGASISLTSDNLHVHEQAVPAEDVVYMLTGNAHSGNLMVNGSIMDKYDTFSYSTLEAGLISYQHDGSENTTDHFHFHAYDYSGNFLLATEYNFIINPVNDAPIPDHNNPLAVFEGESVGITNERFNVIDPDTSPEDLVYKILEAPDNGHLENAGTALGLNDTFTQADVNNNTISYVHNGSETTDDTFVFNVTDDGGNSTPSRLYHVSIYPVNDDPIHDHHGTIEVLEGEEVVFDEILLHIVDRDTPEEQLVYSILEAPTYGSLVKNGIALTKNRTFTQAEIRAGLVSYKHSGSEGNKDQFTFKVTDPDGGETPEKTYIIDVISVNDAPDPHHHNPLVLDEGASAGLGNDKLNVIDPDTPADQLIYSFNGMPSHGMLKLGEIALTLSDTFTQQDVNNNLISYVHSGNESTHDTFRFVVTDDAGNVTVERLYNININPLNDGPTNIMVSAFTLDEGATQTLKETHLSSSDVDNDNLALEYTIQGLPTHGTLKRNGVSLNAGSSFTQQDINSGLITYEHGGGEGNVDVFTFVVIDNAGGTTSQKTFNIEVRPFNDSPIFIELNTLTLNEGASSTIDKALLEALDADDSATSLVYTLDGLPKHGQLRLNGNDLHPGDSITQDDINKGRLSYNHDDSDTISDSFSFTIVDSSGSAPQSKTFNIEIRPIDDLPIAVNIDSGILAEEVQTPLKKVEDTPDESTKILQDIQNSTEVSSPADTISEEIVHAVQSSSDIAHSQTETSSQDLAAEASENLSTFDILEEGSTTVLLRGETTGVNNDEDEVEVKAPSTEAPAPQESPKTTPVQTIEEISPEGKLDTTEDVQETNIDNEQTRASIIASRGSPISKSPSEAPPKVTPGKTPIHRASSVTKAMQHMSKGTGTNFFHGMTTQEMDPTKTKTNEAFYKVSKTLGKHKSAIDKSQDDRQERSGGLSADITPDPQDETTKETSSFFRNFFNNWFSR